jgi:glycosyltransferase involved in cell wall biosynthesis
MDLTLVTCNYNTPNLIERLLQSLKYTSSQLPKVIVMNTSIDDKSDKFLSDNKINYINSRGSSHGEAVNLALKNVTTKYILLVDSDIIFLKDFLPAFEKFKFSNLTLMGKVLGNVAGKNLYERVDPCYCFIDYEQIKNKNIIFFDIERVKKSKEMGYKLYDVGSTMFEDIQTADLLIGDVDLENRYFKHYGGMSWHCQKYNPYDRDTDIDIGGTHPHKEFWNVGQQIERNYYIETDYLKNINIKSCFI